MENSSSSSGRLSAVVEQLVRRLRGLAAADRLSQSSASLLSRLDVDGPLGITQLAQREGITQPAMTQLVGRATAEGLVERTVPAADRRTVMVRLTEQGASALEERRRDRIARLDQHLAGLDDADRVVIEAALPALERLVAAMPPAAPGATTHTTEKKDGNHR